MLIGRIGIFTFTITILQMKTSKVNDNTLTNGEEPNPLEHPTKMCVSKTGDIIYCHNGRIVRISKHDVSQRATLAGLGWISGLEVTEIDKKEYIIINEEGNLYMLDSQLHDEVQVTLDMEVKGDYNLCNTNDGYLAMVRKTPHDDGYTIIFELETHTLENWFVVHRKKVKLGWKEVYDICCITNSERIGSKAKKDPLLAICSPKDGAVASVGLHDGKIKWKVTEKGLGVNLYSMSGITSDRAGQIYVSLKNNTIVALSADNGSILFGVRPDPFITWPNCIRYHTDRVYVVHQVAEYYGKTRQNKLRISQVEID